MARILGSARWDTFESWSADVIYGFDGNDLIYAGTGSDLVYGGNHNDTIVAGSSREAGTMGHWGGDVVYGGGHHDVIDYRFTWDSVTLYGDGGALATSDGNDIIMGGTNDDTIVGGGMNDQIWGGRGNDWIYGDHVDRGGGDDWIAGGYGTDFITTGYGRDTVAYNYASESGPSYAGADVIFDFNYMLDKIDIPGWGTSSNYFELYSPTSPSGEGAFNHASQQASHIMRDYAHRDIVFITDGRNGYLFADTNADNRTDMAIELRGLDSMHDLNWQNII